MVRRAPKGFKDKAKGGKGRSLSKSAISRIMDASDSSVPGASFSDLARKEKQTQVKYDRPADLQKFVDRSRTYQKGIDLGGRVEDGVLQMAGADGIIRNPQGRQILSMRQPGITAVAPRNFMEALGDITRAFTGYNTLSYDPNAIGTPSTTGGTIVRNDGILSNITPLSFIPGGNLIRAGVNVAKDIFFPDPPVVTYGGNSSITVTETPLDDQSSNMSGNPLFDIKPYDSIRVSDMDPSTLTAESTGIEDVFNRIRALQNFGQSYGLDSIQVDPFNLNEGIGYQNQFMFNDTPIDYGLSTTPGGDFGFSLGLQY